MEKPTKEMKQAYNWVIQAAYADAHSAWMESLIESLHKAFPTADIMCAHNEIIIENF